MPTSISFIERIPEVWTAYFVYFFEDATDSVTSEGVADVTLFDSDLVRLVFA